jgi:hypothetical protein
VCGVGHYSLTTGGERVRACWSWETGRLDWSGSGTVGVRPLRPRESLPDPPECATPWLADVAGEIDWGRASRKCCCCARVKKFN